MEVIVGIEQFPAHIDATVMTVGNFDGVHLGHKRIFKRVVEWAKQLEATSAVVTFFPHPKTIVAPSSPLEMITSPDEKARFVAECGLDYLLRLNFTEDFSHLPARDFVEEILWKRLHMRGICIGEDFHFGRNREGNKEMLIQVGKEIGFPVEVISKHIQDGQVVSSTNIRDLIRRGEVENAGHMLGRSYSLTGRVVSGKHRGASLGFPTANIKPVRHFLPKPGVYIVAVECRGIRYQGVANVGYSPTFGDTELSVEVHLLEFSQEIYGEEITLDFLKRLRDEVAFSSITELKEQIKQDTESARRFFQEHK